MKILQIMALTLFMTGCANAQSTTKTAKLEISGEPLPAIRHVTDMKVFGDMENPERTDPVRQVLIDPLKLF